MRCHLTLESFFISRPGRFPYIKPFTAALHKQNNRVCKKDPEWN